MNKKDLNSKILITNLISIISTSKKNQFGFEDDLRTNIQSEELRIEDLPTMKS